MNSMEAGEVATAQALVDTIDDAAAVLNLEGDLLLHNAAWTNSKGCPLCGPPFSSLGLSYREALAESPTDAAKVVGAVLEEFRASGAVPDTRQHTFRVDGGAGRPRWWRTIVRCAATAPRLFVVLHRDVTRQRLAEEELHRSRARLRTIVTGAPIVLFAIDGDGVFTLVEGMGAAGAAFASPELVGQNVFEAYGQMPDLLEVVRAAFAGRVGVTTLEVGNLAYEVRCSPYVGRARAMDGIVGVATDVTERLKAQRMKDEFVSIVSHELRTPLTSIRGSLGLLEGGVAGAMTPKAIELTRIARTNADRLIRLINDILDLEKMESGRMELRRRRLDLAEVCDAVVEELRGIAAGAGVTVQVEAAVDAKVRADSDRIHQVITNLLSNAIKFSSDGDVVRLAISNSAGGRVRLAVHDQGPGISNRDLDRLFQKFSQLDSSSSRAKMGSGLGLVIAKSIVEGHGGRIWVESELGTGSMFAFELAHAVDHQTADETRSTPQSDRDRTISVDAMELRRDGGASIVERARTLLNLLPPDQPASAQASLNDAHATAQILLAELGQAEAAAGVVELRREIETGLRALTEGRSADWSALHAAARSQLSELLEPPQ